MAALKFRAALPVAGLMAAHLPPTCQGPAPGADLRGRRRRRSLAVVPVPAHRGRRRRRGFDAAALLAAALAGRTGVPLTPCLRRVDRGRRQVGAGRALRRSAGRFEAVLVAPPPRAALLVDDVHTTGATLRRLRAGAEGRAARRRWPP